MSKSKCVAVILSGCGHRDGSEITEAVSTLIGLSEAGATYKIFAPEMEFSVVDPQTGNATSERRQVIGEATRIARRQVQPLSELKAVDFEALALPGGFGAAVNLCSWAIDGAKCAVHPEVERVLQEFYKAEKPIAAVCIAPALVARVLGSHGITVTIGNDVATANEISKTGALHENCAVDDFVSDREHRIITAPAYMYDDANPFQVFSGIRKAIRELVEMA
jgi:enhancing lycopene biosynthesis protein 2